MKYSTAPYHNSLFYRDLSLGLYLVCRLSYRNDRYRVRTPIFSHSYLFSVHFVSTKWRVSNNVSMDFVFTSFFTVFVTVQLMQHLHLLWAFKELNISNSILKLHIRQQDRTFRRRKCSFSFVYTL
jgi:hypothetical protein